jgi:hypothetical protein
MRRREQDFSSVSYAELALVKDGGAYGRQAHNADNIDPVEPSRRSVPNAMSLKIYR